MVMNDAALEELLGAYALDALDADEADAVEAFLARRPDLAREADRLVRAAVWVGATEALEAPPTLREAVLTRAHARRVAEAGDAASSAYAASAARLRDTIEALDPDDFSEPTPNGLEARDLVVHLAAQDSLVAQVIDRTVVPEVTEVDVEARTATFVEHFRDCPIDDVIDVWIRSADAVRAWSREDSTSASTISWLGLDLPRDNVLVARAFENWIHRDDLRRIQGRVAESPPAAEMHEVTDLAVRTLPFALFASANSRPGKVARIVLTGPGGGAWTFGMGGERVQPDAAPDVTVTATALAWCLVAGERLDPARLAPDVIGDTSLVEPLVAAAPAFATL
jgi:uncharacterized protein (TIGR03083 family)